MRILIATDAFPPRCGGSGWSTYELARGLRDRRHDIVVVQPRPGRRTSGEREYDGFRIIEFASRVPPIPFVRNYFKNERLWGRLAARLQQVAGEHHADLIHGQHVLTAPAAVLAGRASGIPVVCTVRDYWPVCYWATLIYDPEAPGLCPACTTGMMTQCIRPRAGLAWPAALACIPYMRGNLARRQRYLAGADAVVAVSSVIGRDLRDRSPALRAARVEVIPNPVDIAGIRAAAAHTKPPLPGSYAVFVGKLEINKGAAFLLPAVERARLPWTLAVIGDGAERARIETAARRLGRDVRFTGWLDREHALAWLAHASVLVFPSYGPESLSRVLLEAATLGVPIAAMDTGGTRDIVEHEVTGLLASTPAGLGDDVGRLVTDRALAHTLAANARRRIETRFDSAIVAAHVEALYANLVSRKGRRR